MTRRCGGHAGSSDPALLELDAAARRALVTVEPAHGYVQALCSGVIIAPGWTLTAKHCDEAAPLVVISDALEAPVERRVAHPQLDLLLLHVPALGALEPIAPSDTELSACAIGAPVELAGFGETETGSVGALRFLSTRIAELSATSIVVDGHGRAGACVGDSGGPLLVRDGNGAPRVAGILSGGSASCVDRDQYTRVDRARAWLTDHSATPTWAWE
jgi:S1-C subfamily serine protease